MAGDPRKPPADDVRNPEAPEAVNREQSDDDAQAQTVAEAARHGRRLEDSKKPTGRDESDEEPELVDNLRQKERTGMSGMERSRGQRDHDDREAVPGHSRGR